MGKTLNRSAIVNAINLILAILAGFETGIVLEYFNAGHLVQFGGIAIMSTVVEAYVSWNTIMLSKKGKKDEKHNNSK